MLEAHPEIKYDGEPQNDLGNVPIAVSWHPSYPLTVDKTEWPVETQLHAPKDFDPKGRYTGALSHKKHSQPTVNAGVLM